MDIAHVKSVWVIVAANAIVVTSSLALMPRPQQTWSAGTFKAGPIELVFNGRPMPVSYEAHQGPKETDGELLNRTEGFLDLATIQFDKE